jgi:hypothetical protein
MADYPAILTTLGLQAVAAAIANETTVDITHAAVGDGNGVYRDPDQAHTALAHEVYRAAPNNISVDPENPTHVLVELIIPADQGGWTIREIGIFDAAGNMIGEGKVPATMKPLPAGGGGGTLSLYFPIGGDGATVVNIVIDPATVLASRDYVDTKVLQGIHNHRHDGSATGGILDGVPSTGAGAEFLVSYTPPIPAHVPYMPLTFKANRACPGACTLHVDGMAGVAMKKYGSKNLAAGDFAAGQLVTVVYDGQYYQVMGLSLLAGLGLELDGAGGVRVKLDGATLTNSAAGVKVTPNVFAALAGLSTQTFEAADGASGKQVVNISQFAKSLSANGYQKLPTGFIIQWGSLGSTQVGSGTTFSLTDSFPIAFPNGCLSMTANKTYNGTSPLSIDGDGLMVRYSATQFGVGHRNISGPINWIAVGH